MKYTAFPWEIDSDGRVYPEPSAEVAEGAVADPHILRVNPARHDEFEGNKALIRLLPMLVSFTRDAARIETLEDWEKFDISLNAQEVLKELGLEEA